MKTTVIALLFFLAGASGVAAAKTPGELEVGDLLREAQLQGLSGPSRQLSEFRGMPLLINVWASWCGPCREEMGSLERLSRRYGGKRFQVIGISTDDYVEPAKAALRASRITFSNFIDRRLVMENMLGADRIPLTLLVDAQGRVLGKFYGAKDWDSPEAIELIGRTLRTKL
ncbi:MAG: TlpA disulfide reductase family protein [Rhodocyclaceae bacterium]|nr:TlpA disulfide reductase family protein [Rhodocyclaceae bacterium]